MKLQYFDKMVPSAFVACKVQIGFSYYLST